jgi:hypothetical protein
LPLAAELFGDSGARLITDWLAKQVARIDDADFAEEFAAPVGLLAVAHDPDRLLIGTIDRLNGASRITAERAGRPSILEAVFLSLDP